MSLILTDIEKSQPFPASVEHSCKTCFKGLSLSKLLSVMELLENSMLDSQLLEPGAEVSALARSLSNSKSVSNSTKSSLDDDDEMFDQFIIFYTATARWSKVTRATSIPAQSQRADYLQLPLGTGVSPCGSSLQAPHS